LKKNHPVKTLDFNGLVLELHPEVYEPAEDSFQLAEAIDVKPNDRVLEIGTGTGIIALECTRRGADVVCSDVNPFAVELVKCNYSRNKSLLTGSLDVRLGDLFTVVGENEKFDVIIFNPPYLPTKKEDLVSGSGWFDIAVDGGTDGLALTEKFINHLQGYLKKNGRAFFVFSSLSDRSKLENIISNAGFKAKVIVSRCFDDEQIDIYYIKY
jgi:release factor glutamine methyltransferase